MTSFLYCDLETYSPVPINHGTHAYAEKVEVLLWAYARDDGEPKVWDVTTGEPMPDDLEEDLADPSVTVVWHNGGMFDLIVLLWAMQIDLPLERQHDTLVQALSHSLPGKLESLCAILKVGESDAKDTEGKTYINLFCKPGLNGERNTRLTHPEKWEGFKRYAGKDITAMRAARKRMPMWNYQGKEHALWQLDQRINRRGMCIDMDLVHAAVRAVTKAQKELARRTVALTDGEVQTATQRDVMLKHILEAYGVDLPDMTKSTLERRIDDPDLPSALRELLAIRLQAATSSTSKYKSLLKGVSSDGRLRGTKQFNGAMRTGRWAGRLFQPDNLPRPTLDHDDIEMGIEALLHDAADMLYNNVMALTSSAIRGCIVAPHKKKLTVADLSNIEGRDQAWLAGENWKLQAFRAFDAGQGHDLYALAYAKSFGVSPEDVIHNKKHGDGSMRQIGKVQELALGYEGGVGAFVTFALVYNVDLAALPAKVLPAADQELVREARDFLTWTVKQKRTTFGLSDDTFVTCDVLKRAWRQAHPNIAAMWSDLKATVIEAIDSPGKTFTLRALKIRRDGAWLRIVLPSGRSLCYPSPRVDDGQISYMGVNQYSRKWTRLKSYGGKFFENICQAVARDVMAENMPRIEEAGYEIVLTVHDEVVTEAPDTPEFTHRHLSALLAMNPAWAPGMPRAAAGFESYRYKKD